MRKFRAKLGRLLRNAFALSALIAVLAPLHLFTMIPRHTYRWLGIPVLIGLCLWMAFRFRQKPEKYINKQGYVVLKRQNELEHRFIAKQMLGRELKPNEVVHHINGKRTDNEFKNLCLMDREKHEHFHSWLSWKRKKSGKYPHSRDQKRALAEEYGGTLLEALAGDRIIVPRTSDNTNVHVSRDSRPMLRENSNPDVSKRLFEDLRRERTKLASERQVPAYMIFNDKTLHKMVETLPDTEQLMLKIRGVGPTKFRMYGSHFIAVIKRFKTELKVDSKNRRDSA